MEFDAVLLPPRRAESVARGYWHDCTINDELDACVAHCPEKLALTAVRGSSGEARRLTYRELAMLADRTAVGLAHVGVGRNDVIAMQLPNWPQFTLLYLACSRIGAVLNPLMPIFREHELAFMLKHGEAKVFVVPRTFRNFDHEAMARGLKKDLPALERIVVVGGGGEDGFDALLAVREWEKAPDAASILTRSRPGPDDITQLIYTSGTTDEPKGVMHSANTLMANIIPYAERLRLGEDDIVLMASPMAHQTGFMYGLMMPIVLKASAVALDVSDPAKAAALIRSERVTFTMASTPFLTDLTRAATESGDGVPTLKTFLCAGAPIPGPLVEQARAGLGAKIVSAWGMTENGAVTLIKLDDDDRLAFTTDGCPLRGRRGEGGRRRRRDLASRRIRQARRPRLLKFRRLSQAPAMERHQRRGLVRHPRPRLCEPGRYIRISGRSKDVIIRGGENIPVVEIESLLYKHPRSRRSPSSPIRMSAWASARAR